MPIDPLVPEAITISPERIPQSQLVKIEKTSGTAFLNVAARAWEDAKILMIGEAPGAGLKEAALLKAAPGGGWWEGVFVPDASAKLAQISTTSGTTGQPKAIAISRRAISDTVDRLIGSMELDASVREYVGVPVTYSFGLGRVRAVSAAGGTVFLPDNGFRPDEIAHMLRDGEINALSAVPTQLRTILANPDIIGAAGRRLRWLELGSQHMAAEEKRRLTEIFPEAIILQHYGLTEASRSSFLRIDQAADEVLSSVGHAVGEGAIRIAQDGRIEVRGPHLASGIVTDGTCDPLPVDENGWLRTADLGVMRDGWLHFRGRADDVANIGGVKIAAELFERQLMEKLPPDTPVAACVIKDLLRGEKLAVVTMVGQKVALSPGIFDAVAEAGLRAGDVELVELDAWPRTETGKLQRQQLADRVQAQLAMATAPEAIAASDDGALTEQEARIAMIWSDALGLSVDRDDSFHDLGGDSLSAVSVMIRAEQAGLPPEVMQRMFAGETVRQIAAALDGTPSRQRMDIRAIRADALNAVRGLFALLIVVSHWGPFFVERTGAAGAAIWSVTAPLLRIGTPGFAMVYGMGLGLFFFGRLDSGRDRLRQRIRANTRLLVIGVALIASAQTWRLIATGTGFGPIWPEQLFYEVILFYALMVPTSLFWLRRIAATRDRVFGSLMLAAAAYGVFLLLSFLMPVNPFTGWASLGWHMLVAPYAYPRLLAAAALGLAAALWLQQFKDATDLRALCAKWGAALGALGALLVASLPGGWTQNAGEIVAIPAFAGAALLLYAGGIHSAEHWRTTTFMRIAIICGMLAFPIFIGHGMVIPIKAALESYGISGLISTVVPVGLFAAIMVWLGRRIHRMMFGRVGTN